MYECILPKEAPMITTYPKEANILSILLNYEKSYPWIMNNFIQLTCYNNQYLDYYDFYYRNCPLVDYQRINKNIILDISDGIIPFLISSIKKGYYIYLAVNTKYIPAYDYDHDIPHDLFLYGYNTGKEIFYISDNFVNGKYSNSICRFTELLNAINNFRKCDYQFRGFRDCIELLSYNFEERACFEEYRVKESMEDYLLCRPTKSWYVANEIWDKKETKMRTFGLDCYETIRNHINIAKQTGEFENGSRRAFYLMWEHKKIMLIRLKYMQENGLFSNAELIDEYAQIEKSSKICLFLMLKYTLKKDSSILEHIFTTYKGIEENEISIIHKLMKYIT